MTTMPASQAFLIVGLSAVSEPASIEDRVGLGADDVVQRVDLRLDGVLDVLDLAVRRGPASGPLFTDTSATRCICWRQSLPTKLFER